MQNAEKRKTTNSKPIPHIPTSVQGSDGGRAQGETASKRNETETPEKEG
jgi:hypothetical protein